MTHVHAHIYVRSRRPASSAPTTTSTQADSDIPAVSSCFSLFTPFYACTRTRPSTSRRSTCALRARSSRSCTFLPVLTVLTVLDDSTPTPSILRLRGLRRPETSHFPQESHSFDVFCPFWHPGRRSRQSRVSQPPESQCVETREKGPLFVTFYATCP